MFYRLAHFNLHVCHDATWISKFQWQAFHVNELTSRLACKVQSHPTGAKYARFLVLICNAWLNGVGFVRDTGYQG